MSCMSLQKKLHGYNVVAYSSTKKLSLIDLNQLMITFCHKDEIRISRNCNFVVTLHRIRENIFIISFH